MVNMTAMLMVMQVREDEEVKAQLIQRIDNLSADNDCLKSEMDLVRNRNKKYNNLKHSSYGRSRNDWTLQCKINFN